MCGLTVQVLPHKKKLLLFQTTMFSRHIKILEVKLHGLVTYELHTSYFLNILLNNSQVTKKWQLNEYITRANFILKHARRPREGEEVQFYFL